MTTSEPPTETPEVERFDALCETCGVPFGAIAVTVLGCRIFSRHCPGCVARHEQTTAAMLNGAAVICDREAEWKTLCPAAYRTAKEGGQTDPARLLKDCPRLAEVTGWKFGPQGLLLRGATGKCKTRAVWRLLRSQFIQERVIYAVSAGGFARQYADACGKFTRSLWFDSMASVDILFLDDLGKSEWSAGAWGEFFELVEERTKHGRPIIVTTNETGESLAAKAKDPVTWEPLYRRLKESCQQIKLTEEPQPK